MKNKRISRVFSFLLAFTLILQLAVPTYANTGGTAKTGSGVETKLVFEPGSLFAGIEYGIDAITTGGEVAADGNTYDWSFRVLNGSTSKDITNEVNLIIKATGYNDSNALYQKVSFTVPLEYAGQELSIFADYYGAESLAGYLIKIKQPITEITSVKENDSNMYSHYDEATSTMYLDKAITIRKDVGNLAFGGLTVKGNSSEDSIALNKPMYVYGSLGNFYVTDDAEDTTTFSLYPSSGYKVNKNVTLVKGIPATEANFYVKKGLFSEGKSVASFELATNKENSAVWGVNSKGEPKIVDYVYNNEDPIYVVKESGSNTIKAQVGETIVIGHTVKPKTTNDTFRYDLYNNLGQHIKTLEVNEFGECEFPTTNTGNYRIHITTVSVGNGCLERAWAGSFYVNVKEPNPIVSLVTSKSFIELGNKEFTNKDGVTYKTSGKFTDYLTVNPTEYDDIILYSSSNPDIVKIDENGYFSVPETAVGGTARLTARSMINDRVEASLDVTVIPGTRSMSIADPKYPVLPAGHSQNLELVVNPENSQESVTWKSSDDSLVTVNKDGKVKANANYTGAETSVTIYATSDSGIEAKKSISICKENPTASVNMVVTGIVDDKSEGRVESVGTDSYTVVYGDTFKVTYDNVGTDSSKSPTDLVEWELVGTDKQLSDYFTVVSQQGNTLTLKANKSSGAVKLGAYAIRSGEDKSSARNYKTVTLDSIVQAPVTKLKVSFPEKTVYTGKALKPKMVVKHVDKKLNIDKVLVEGVDYTVKCENNVEVGKGYVTITGKGNYTGSIKKSFVISRKPLTDKDVKVTINKTKFVYNNRSQSPKVTVKVGNKVLKENIDYKLTETNSKYPGRAKITVRGINNYSGYVAKYYIIQLATPKVSAILDNETGKPVLQWAKVYKAKSYAVYRSNTYNGKYKKIGTVPYSYKGGNCIDKTAVAGKRYYYRVIAIHGDKQVNSNYSVPTNVVCDCAAPLLRHTTYKTYPKIYWKAVSGANKYKVYRATSPRGKYYKVTTTTKKNYIDKKAKYGQTYYYKVIAVSKKTSAANSYYSNTVSCKRK